MATIISLDAYRQRRAHPRQPSARERAGLPELLRETPAPSCAVCYHRRAEGSYTRGVR